MKTFFKYLAMGACCLSLATACNDNDGDGTFIWEGSQNPENTSYRNPVWEPSLAGGTLLRSGTSFAAISQETQWAAGVPYACPSLLSADLMKYTYSQQAYTYPVPTGKTDEETGEEIITPGSRPDWLTGEIDELSADFARTLNGYYMFYGSSADNAIGAASAPSGLGPYTDQGSLITAAELGTEKLVQPHFSVVASTNYYLGYTTENGSYLQQLNMVRNRKPATRGDAVQVSGPDFTDICIFRLDKDNYYLLGTVTVNGKSEIHYAKASAITGPYCDKAGKSLLDGSTGEPLVIGGDEYENPCNAMRIFESENGYYYLGYNATETGRDNMPSGYRRQPLFVSPLSMDDNGWFAATVTPARGWTAPRFE